MNEVHKRLADVLGIDWRGQPVTGFDVHARAAEPVRVTVHHMVTKPDQIVEVHRRLFWLEATGAPVAEAPPFDLDRMCEEARKRVATSVEAGARRGYACVRNTFALMRERFGESRILSITWGEGLPR